MVYNYFFLMKIIREKRRNYKLLTIDEKIDLLNLEIRVEGKRLMESDAHTKAERKKDKQRTTMLRNHKEQKAKRNR
ncbi:hypothetical protein CBEIBR21_06445 [Clostridium beijerinckii]|uniref:Uncharacterized protein n=2 Tax=Clostridium beijerinckii TaxID=1520 RepID=A0A1S9N9A7_CLOBE|nr:hypothetical protein CBEIBR21_06445 [Clostridium beijerinckii]